MALWSPQILQRQQRQQQPPDSYSQAICFLSVRLEATVVQICIRRLANKQAEPINLAFGFFSHTRHAELSVFLAVCLVDLQPARPLYLPGSPVVIHHLGAGQPEREKVAQFNQPLSPVDCFPASELPVVVVVVTVVVARPARH